MATGKHYRSDSAPRQTRTSAPQRTAQPAAAVKKDDYEDLYSYEEPREAKRGTRRPTTASSRAPMQKKKRSKAPVVIAWLCLLAAAGIMVYVLWDLGLVSMILSMLG